MKQTNNATPVLQPAELPRRFLAFLLDVMVLLPVVLVLVNLLQLSGAPGIVAELAIRAAYFVLCLSGPWGATVGMRIVGLYVTDLHGKRLTALEALERFFAWLLPLLPLLSTLPEGVKQMVLSWMILLWYVPMLLTKQRTGVHDLLSRTRVLQRVEKGIK